MPEAAWRTTPWGARPAATRRCATLAARFSLLPLFRTQSTGELPVTFAAEQTRGCNEGILAPTRPATVGAFTEVHMLDYSIMKPEGVLVLKPQAALIKEGFGGISAAVDSYLSEHPKLHGGLGHWRRFPGGEQFGGVRGQVHCVREDHKKIERVALGSRCSPRPRRCQPTGRPP